MPNVAKNAVKALRSKNPATLTPAERRKLNKIPSPYREMFGAHRGVGNPKGTVALQWLASNGNKADKVLAERRALAVLKARHHAELEEIYYAELAYVEAGGE